MKMLFDHWREACKGRAMPRRGDIDPAAFRAALPSVWIYRLDEDGTIATTFTFRKGGFDGEKKVYTPRGYIVDEESNALWGMQFLWPFKGDYRIIYLDEASTTTVIGRQKRDYVWLMARSPEPPEAAYQRAVEAIRASQRPLVVSGRGARRAADQRVGGGSLPRPHRLLNRRRREVPRRPVLHLRHGEIHHRLGQREGQLLGDLDLPAG